MKAKFKLSYRDVYRKLLHILNAFQEAASEEKLASSEIDLLAEFLILPKKKFEYQPFSTLAKNKVIENAKAQGWSLSRENINNKIYSLVLKGYLWRDDDGVVYLKPHIKKLIDQLRKDIDVTGKYTFEVELALTNEETKDKTDELRSDIGFDGGPTE